MPFATSCAAIAFKVMSFAVPFQAFQGADDLFLNTHEQSAESEIQQGKNAIDAAKEVRSFSEPLATRKGAS